MVNLLIKNGYVLTMDGNREVIENGSVSVDAGKIVAVGKDIDDSADIVIDAKDKVVMPGLINAHTHLAMTLLRGMADDMPLKPWLQDVIWPAEKKITEKNCYAGALLGALEMIKSGTTCFADMYFYMQDVAKAVGKAGLRASLSYGIIEADDITRRESEIKAGEAFVKSANGSANGRITAMFGPHAPYTCSPELLMQVKDRAKKHGVGIHIHLAETKANVDEISKRYGNRPVEHLNEIGFLGPEVMAAHCVWLSEREIGMLRGTGTNVVHNPVSNMKLGSGVAPVSEMLEAAIPVALGTDGATSNNSLDMFNEMKFAALLNKSHKLDPTAVPAKSVLEMATINGAKALGLDDKIGSIEEGKQADIILVDMNKPHLTPSHSVVSNLVYNSVGSDVDTVLVNGNAVMQERKVLTLDEKTVLEKAQEAAADLVGGEQG